MKSLAVAYALKKRAQKIHDAEDLEKDEQKEIPEPMAEGGDLVERCIQKRMKKMSEGGIVSNEGSHDELDDLVQDDHLEFHDTEANSGDDLGSDLNQEDDLLERIMRKRSKR